MSIDSEQSESKQRITFRPSVEVLALLEKIPTGKKSDHINKLLIKQKESEAALRAIRLKVSNLEKQIIKLENGCPKCCNQGKFNGIALGHSDGKLSETKITIYCECNAGKEQIRQSWQRYEKGLQNGDPIFTSNFESI